MPTITITLPDRDDLDLNETVARVTSALADVPDSQIAVVDDHEDEEVVEPSSPEAEPVIEDEYEEPDA